MRQLKAQLLRGAEGTPVAESAGSRAGSGLKWVGRRMVQVGGS